MKKIVPLFIFIVLLISLVNAAYETVQGIEQESFEYENYKSCVDSCSTCELNCKERLLEQAAETRQDETFCLQLADEARKTFCLDNIYRTKSVSQNDLTLCDKISLPEEAERCKLNVQINKVIEAKDESLCNSLNEEQVKVCKDSFYQTMAFQTQDKSYCNKLDEIAKQNCLDNLESIGVTESAGVVATSTFDYKKMGIYAGMGFGAIIFLVLIIFLIRKISKPKKPKEVPLVVQQKPQQVNPVQQ